jgi:hypothetical protein
MKRALNSSLGANLLLTALAVWAGWEAWHSHRALRRASKDKPGHTASSNAPIAAIPAGQTPFHWSQVESTDYRTYILNLRRIGCPEQTVRDIISSDVHNLYEYHRGAILRKEGQPAASLAGRVELDAELSRLDREESSLIAVLLGDGLSRNSNPTGPLDSSGARVAQAGNRLPPELPLVFREISQPIQLDAQQSETIEYLRQRFQEALGPVAQNPSNPAYANKWRTAQRESDDLLAGLLGGEFYLNYDLQTGAKPQTAR